MYQPSFADAFVAEVKAGQYDSYDGRRGLVSIEYDGTRYYYCRAGIVTRGGYRRFKRWFAFECRTDRLPVVVGTARTRYVVS